MSIESRKVMRAFLQGEAMTRGSDSTDGVELRLHRNPIAWIRPDGILIGTLAGWSTNTTRNRLNELLQEVGSVERFLVVGGITIFGDHYRERDLREIENDEWIELGKIRRIYTNRYSPMEWEFVSIEREV